MQKSRIRRNTKTANANSRDMILIVVSEYIFLAFPAVAKLSCVYGKRILIYGKVILDILIICVDVFQFYQVFIQSYAFRLQMFSGGHAVLSQKERKERVNKEKCPDYKEISDKTHSLLNIDKSLSELKKRQRIHHEPH